MFKLKLKREQRKANAAEPSVANQHRTQDAVISNGATLSPSESHKRKSSTDDHHGDDVQTKKLKFSSLFTNNPEIPHIDR